MSWWLIGSPPLLLLHTVISGCFLVSQPHTHHSQLETGSISFRAVQLRPHLKRRDCCHLQDFSPVQVSSLSFCKVIEVGNVQGAGAVMNSAHTVAVSPQGPRATNDLTTTSQVVIIRILLATMDVYWLRNPQQLPTPPPPDFTWLIKCFNYCFYNA